MYNSPSQFLNWIKNKYSNPYPLGKRDHEFDTLTKKKLKEVGIDFPKVSQRIELLNNLISDQFNDILLSQERIISNKISLHISAGVLETGEVNAFIAKGSKNIYAILMNSGLMTLLNKSIKLWVGSTDLKNIEYCNRKLPNELTYDDIKAMLFELFDNYVDTKIPRGAMIKLKDKALGIYSTTLHLSEAFVICHEIGHYLNGDLNETNSFVPIKSMPGLEKYDEGENHEKEFNADITGYRLFDKYVNKHHSEIDTNTRIFAVICVMDLIGAISRDPSRTHPEAKQRTLNIIKKNYGPDAEKYWSNTYNKNF